MVPNPVIVCANVVATAVDRESLATWNQRPHAVNAWGVGGDYLEGCLKPSETLRNLSSEGRVEKTVVIAEEKVGHRRDESGLKFPVDIQLVTAKNVEDAPKDTGKY